MNMFFILLIYHLVNVFFEFPWAYFRKYTAFIKKFFFNGNKSLHFKQKNMYNNYVNIRFSCSLKTKLD